jgi:hypothetical protein
MRVVLITPTMYATWCVAFMGTVSPISEGPAHPIFPVLIVNESGSALATTSQYVHALAYETTAPSLKNEAGWPVHR